SSRCDCRPPRNGLRRPTGPWSYTCRAPMVSIGLFKGLRGTTKDASRFVHDGILDPDRVECLLPLAARNAGAAMDRAVPVARPRDLERHVQLEAQPDDFLFRLAAHRHENLHGGLVLRPQAEVEHAVQAVEEMRARVRERLRVECAVDTDDVACGIGLR